MIQIPKTYKGHRIQTVALFTPPAAWDYSRKTIYLDDWFVGALEKDESVTASHILKHVLEHEIRERDISIRGIKKAGIQITKTDLLGPKNLKVQRIIEDAHKEAKRCEPADFRRKFNNWTERHLGKSYYTGSGAVKVKA